jgi:hypothetical protein
LTTLLLLLLLEKLLSLGVFTWGWRQYWSWVAW